LNFSRRQLDAGIRDLEEEVERGRFNTLCLRAFANASAVLAQHDLAGRALRLLRAAPDEAFWAGMITNVELPKNVPERLRTLDPPDELEKRRPRYCEEDIASRIRSYARTEGHIGSCLDGRIEEACKLTGVKLEEVGATLAVLGNFDAALSVARDPLLEGFRRRGVLLILVIEFFRGNQLETCQAILTELESTGLDAWDRILLALGFGGREPWCGYPYPDW
jgi:hypothetical protein